MLCIETNRQRNKCTTTPSLNTANTGHFLCSTSRLDRDSEEEELWISEELV